MNELINHINQFENHLEIIIKNIRDKINKGCYVELIDWDDLSNALHYVLNVREIVGTHSVFVTLYGFEAMELASKCLMEAKILSSGYDKDSDTVSLIKRDFNEIITSMLHHPHAEHIYDYYPEIIILARDYYLILNNYNLSQFKRTMKKIITDNRDFFINELSKKTSVTPILY